MEQINIIENPKGTYSCDIGISKEEWLNLLKDNAMPQTYKESLLKFYYYPNHCGSCTAVCDEMGGNPKSLNLTITKCGEYVQRRLNRFNIVRKDGGSSYWLVTMCEGKELSDSDKGVFEWKLRSELVEAIRDYLYWYLVECYKGIRNEIPLDNEEYYEIYKWELLTASQGKSPFEIVADHVAHPTKPELGGFSNLIDAVRDNKALKYLIETKPSELEKVLVNLADESVGLNNRLQEFKVGMTALLPQSGYNSKANDERTASTILTCLNPDKYTLYKNDVYKHFCKYLGVGYKSAGQCFEHFLEILSPLYGIARNDEQLHQLLALSLEGKRKSDLLLAQDVLWVLFMQFPQRLGYIQPLLDRKKNQENINSEYNMESKYQKYIDLLEANKNLILTGAPGTGKTYLAKAIAEEMGAVVGFVQFHPSYDYTDFVEGLRPVKDDGIVVFRLMNGIFKAFCSDALEVERQENPFYGSYESLLQKIDSGEIKTLQQKRGTPSQPLKRRGDSILFKSKKKDGYDEANTVTWTRMSTLLEMGFDSLERFDSIKKVEEIREAIGSCNDSNYWAVLNYLLNNVSKNKNTDKNTIKKHIFIIDEINRGEISKIFGELFFSIDPGYRGEKGRVKTQYQNMIEDGDVFKDGFFVPENVYIIGTMNDIDRSVESMDFAMRRRFAWQEVSAKESYENMIENLPEFTGVKDEIKARMFNLNMAIAKTEGLGEAYQIGAAYFRKYLDYKYNANPFDCLWDNHLKGLLFEYLRGNRKADELLKKLHEAYNKTHLDEQPTHTNNG